MAASVGECDVRRFRAVGWVAKEAFFSSEEAAAMRAAVEELRHRDLMANILVDGATQNLQMAWLSLHLRLFQLLPWMFIRKGGPKYDNTAVYACMHACSRTIHSKHASHLVRLSYQEAHV